jgi:hypothetical protein
LSYRVFLLSPASLSGLRGRALLEGRSIAPFLPDLEAGGSVPLGEVYAFISSLYFRGKRSYALRFARPPSGVGGVWVITPTRGLLPVDTPVSLADLRELGAGSIEPDDRAYRSALIRTARALGTELDACEAVLLGSIASARYVEPLLEVFGARLSVPETFAGRGDMSRGGLLLRCVAAGEELVYAPAEAATRHGARPPKLDPRTRPRRGPSG